MTPGDTYIRSGRMRELVPTSFPGGTGVDAAGVVDELGPGVSGVRAGDEVFGLTAFGSANADLLGVAAGQTLLIQGAAGGVGTVAVQLAVARGASVIGTASERNHDLLRSLGAVPTTYGPGLPDRVRSLAPSGVDGVFDCAGGDLPALVEEGLLRLPVAAAFPLSEAAAAHTLIETRLARGKVVLLG